jgi:hypothetical protein
VTTGIGSALRAVNNNSKNSSPALFVETNGAGPAASFATLDIATGSALEATIDGLENPSPAVAAATSGVGSALEASITNATSSAAAVLASTNGTGNALQVEGRAGFSRCGLTNVPGESESVTVTMALSTSSLILATLQGEATSVGSDGPPIAVSSAIPAGDLQSFTINLTGVPSSSVQVAWFVVESLPAPTNP